MRMSDQDKDKDKEVVHLLDYGAGNVRSVRNAIKALSYTVVDITKPEQIDASVKKLIFPGVGNFASAMKFLNDKRFAEPLKAYIKADRAFLGICLGLQTLFEESEECPGVSGLGIIPGKVEKFDESTSLSVPHIGWNGLEQVKPSRLFTSQWKSDLRVYFVHSFCARATTANEDWILAKTHYGSDFISAVQKGNVIATQFHPEKSGPLGLTLFKAFLSSSTDPESFQKPEEAMVGLSKRVIACLDVRRDENEELVVTKGISYDVMENGEGGEGEAASKRMRVRNLGDPVEMSDEYSAAGCDELTFLSIKSYDTNTILDTPLHRLLERTSEKVFVPLTIGGGIRDYVGKDGVKVTALDVASKYFRSGADKVSIGSDAVRSVQKLKANGGVPDGASPIETISHAYGKQAVVISVDPKRVYISTPEACEEAKKAGYTVVTLPDGSNCWYAATTSGGKKVTDLDAVELVKGCEKLGAGEILLNCIDTDGKNQGFDLELTKAVCNATTLPVIASSGAGKAEHFSELFKNTRAEAGLAAGIFHRKEVSIEQVKDHLKEQRIPAR